MSADLPKIPDSLPMPKLDDSLSEDEKQFMVAYCNEFLDEAAAAKAMVGDEHMTNLEAKETGMEMLSRPRIAQAIQRYVQYELSRFPEDLAQALMRARKIISDKKARHLDVINTIKLILEFGGRKMDEEKGKVEGDSLADRMARAIVVAEQVERDKEQKARDQRTEGAIDV